jgi:hypothetical protein
MTPFSTLSQAIQDKLKALSTCAGVSIVQDDDQNVATMIAKATGSIGMLILLAIPDFKNKDGTLTNIINADLKIQILIREVPTIWRRQSNNNPIHCSDLAQAISPPLQGLVVPGFEPLRILTGLPLGNFVTMLTSGKTVSFQDYLLELETMQIFSD